MSRGLRTVLLAGHVHLQQRGCLRRLNRSSVRMLPSNCCVLRYPWKRALRSVVVYLLPPWGLLCQGPGLELHLLSTHNLARVVDKSVHDWTRLAPLLRPGRFVRDLAQLLELQPLKVNLLEVFHLRVAGDALKGALGEVREVCQRLHLEVTSINKLIDIFLVKLFEFLFKRAVVLGQSVLGSAVKIFRVLGQAGLGTLVVCKKY